MEKMKTQFEQAVEADKIGVCINTQAISIADVLEKVGFHTTLVSAAGDINGQRCVTWHLHFKFFL